MFSVSAARDHNDTVFWHDRTGGRSRNVHSGLGAGTCRADASREAVPAARSMLPPANIFRRVVITACSMNYKFSRPSRHRRASSFRRWRDRWAGKVSGSRRSLYQALWRANCLLCLRALLGRCKDQCSRQHFVAACPTCLGTEMAGHCRDRCRTNSALHCIAPRDVGKHLVLAIHNRFLFVVL